jgi:hypothetical protein
MNSVHFLSPKTSVWVFTTVLVVAAPIAGLRAEPTVTAFYNPADGNITLSVLENGSPGTLAVSAFQFLSPSQYLSGSAASIPPSAISAFTVLNTDESAIYEPPRQYAEIYANGLGGTLFSTTWDLGNVAQTGLTQSDLNSGFTSNGDVLSPAQPGKFLYETNATWVAGNLVAVPEPTGMLMVLGATGFFAAAMRRRRLPSWWRSQSGPVGVK